MTPIRLGAVGYLNARPLTWALDRSPERWQVRYDVPSVCAELLHAGQVDLGLVPSIEYLHAADYRFVPGVGIGSTGKVASVALFGRGSPDRIRRITLDTSSRTSAALLKILCREHFGISPEFVAHGPDLTGIVEEDDAALLIGDPAFDTDPEAHRLWKIDLGEAWTAMTGLPFVYAAWTGRKGAIAAADVEALQRAQTAGVEATSEIAREYGHGDAAVAARAEAYLRDNVKYGLGPDDARGLRLFLDYAFTLGLAPRQRALEYY